MNKGRHSSAPEQVTCKCPRARCGSNRVVCNGSYSTESRGLARRFLCRLCGHTWKEFQKPSGMFAPARILDVDETVLQAFALVALGLPLRQVEGLIGRKSETIHSRLLRCFANKRLWHESLRPTKLPAPKHVLRVRNELKARIQNTLHCQIVVTPTGKFYRVDDDPQVARWLTEAKRFEPTKSGRLLNQLSWIERVVFDQVRCPNADAHVYAKLGGAIALKPGASLPENMTPKCLAQGLGLDLGMFIELLESLAGLLRNPAIGEQRTGLVRG